MMTKEDVLQPVRQAMLSVFTISVLWGKAERAEVEVRWGKVFFLILHFARAAQRKLHLFLHQLPPVLCPKTLPKFLNVLAVSLLLHIGSGRPPSLCLWLTKLLQSWLLRQARYLTGTLWAVSSFWDKTYFSWLP